jgi:hypothetical protein
VKHLSVAALTALWMAASVAGSGWLTRYKETPGEHTEAPATWPEASRIPRDARRPTLVMMVHPKCPCTRASLNELGRLITRNPNQVALRIVILRPDSVEKDWEKTDLVERANDLADAKVLIDEGGKETALFGALTSGQTYLYSKDGVLLFSGGLTESRGHEGDSDGSRAIEAMLRSGGSMEQTQLSAHVFGCAMNDPKEVEQQSRR